MYLLLFALVQLILFIHYVPIYLTIIVGFFYLLWYFDGKEYTGERRWDAFRSLRVWKWMSPVDHVFPLKTDMSQTQGKKLLVFPNALTPSALIWGVGLHGGGTKFGTRAVHYIVPPIFMWIPFVRDVLMWSGAVTYSLHNPARSMFNVMTRLLEDGRIVAYVPSNFYSPSPTAGDVETGVPATDYTFPKDDVLEYIVKERAQVVPVFVQREAERYTIRMHDPRLKWIHAHVYKYLDYPLPMVYWFKFYHPTKPHPIVISFGPIMSGEVYTSVDSLLSALKEQVEMMNQPILMESNKATKGS